MRRVKILIRNDRRDSMKVRSISLIITLVIFFLTWGLPPVFETWQQVQAAEILTPRNSYPVKVPSRSFAGGLTFDGSSLWISAQSVCDPARLQKYSLQGELQETFLSPRGGNMGGGLAFDGTSLYNLNYNTNMGRGFHTIDRLSSQGEFLDEASAAGGPYNTFGLTWNGNGFYQGHSPTVKQSSTIYQLDVNRQVLSNKSLPFYTRGLAWDGNHLWVSTGKFRKVYELDADLKILRVYTTTVALADITWANGGLWGLESNANRLHQFSIEPR